MNEMNCSHSRTFRILQNTVTSLYVSPAKQDTDTRK